jgi:hypothetical protein
MYCSATSRKTINYVYLYATPQQFNWNDSINWQWHYVEYWHSYKTRWGYGRPWYLQRINEQSITKVLEIKSCLMRFSYRRCWNLERVKLSFLFIKSQILVRFQCRKSSWFIFWCCKLCFRSSWTLQTRTFTRSQS